MFPKKIRLQPKKLIGVVFKCGDTRNGAFFLLKTLKNQNRENRYCIVVSSKVSKKAHERNLLKRRAREIVLAFNKEIKASGNDVVFIFKKTALGLSFPDLKSEMNKYLSKLSSQ